jgi:hypothetical protein
MMAAKRKQPAGTGSEALRRLEKLTPAEKARTGAELLRRAQRGELTTADTEILETITKRAAEISGIAMQPLEAQLERIAKRIALSQRVVVQDYLAAMKAAAEQPTEYAVVMPRAERAAIAHNLSAARTDSPQLVPAGAAQQRAVQMGVDTYQDYLELPTRYLYSPEAERLLSILTGKWRTAYRTAECNADIGKHTPECAHLERTLIVSKRSLARELHGSAGGSQVAMVSKCLQELAKARHTYSKTRKNSETKKLQIVSSADSEPILSYARIAEGDTLESAAASRTLTLILGEQYHQQLMRGLYRVERTERLTCWRESWELELMLRLITTPTTRIGSNAMRNSSKDGRSIKLLLSRTQTDTELGTAQSLMGGSRSLTSPATTLRRLEKFMKKLKRESLADELQVYSVVPQRAGNRITGWYLGLGYPEQPLTAGQAKREAQAGRARLRAGEIPTDLQRAALAKVRAYPRQPADAVGEALATLGTALSAPKRGTKRIEARHEVQQNKHETAPRLVLDSLTDSTPAQEPKLAESESGTGDRFTLYRQEWDTYGAGVRRALKARHPELADLPD